VEETVNESDSQMTEVLEPQIIVGSNIESEHKKHEQAHKLAGTRSKYTDKSPAVKRFFEGTLKSFQLVGLGYNIADMFRILSVAILRSVPWTIKKHSSILDREIGKILERLWKNTVVEIGSIKYTLLDSESFRIASYEFESFMSTWLQLKTGEILVDIGAHIGKYALSAAKAVGNEGLVVAIEPHPLNYKTLQKNIRLNKLVNVVALNIAAWNMDCKLNLFVGDTAGHHSAKLNSDLGRVRVKAMAIDNVLKDLGLARVDFIKIDVEGAECEVLYGLEKTVKKYKPKILIEVFHENVDEIERIMKKFKYGLIRISPCFEENAYFICIPLCHKSEDTSIIISHNFNQHIINSYASII
jgi:FkbM family methyltransferase